MASTVGETLTDFKEEAEVGATLTGFKVEATLGVKVTDPAGVQFILLTEKENMFTGVVTLVPSQ